MTYALIQNDQVVSGEESSTIFPWWSFTKTVIAAAVLVQVRDKRLFLDDPIDKQPYTLRQLLRHESGLPDYGTLAEYHAAVQAGKPPWTVEELLERANADRLLFAPGSDWAYSNIGYLHVRRLIEQSTDEDLGRALERLVFRPLGLTQSRIAGAPGDLAHVHMGELINYDPGWVYHGLAVGPLKEAALLLNRLMTCSLIPKDLLNEMLSKRPLGGPIAGRPWTSPGYGLGLMIGKTGNGLSVAGHTGGGPGSVIAVYHKSMESPTTCAVFSAGSEAAEVESDAFSRLAL